MIKHSSYREKLSCLLFIIFVIYIIIYYDALYFHKIGNLYQITYPYLFEKLDELLIVINLILCIILYYQIGFVKNVILKNLFLAIILLFGFIHGVLFCIMIVTWNWNWE